MPRIYVNKYENGKRGCYKCNKIKLLTEFHKDGSAAGGHCYMCKSCVTLKNKKDWELRKDYHRARYRKRDLVRNYGITVEKYEKMLVEQNGVCAICKNSNVGSTFVSHFTVDHDHKTKNVRGLLCVQCNFGLGQFNDDIKLLLKAALYLETHASTSPEQERSSDCENNVPDKLFRPTEKSVEAKDKEL